MHIHHGSISHLSGLDQLKTKRKIRDKRKIGNFGGGGVCLWEEQGWYGLVAHVMGYLLVCQLLTGFGHNVRE